MRNIDVSGLDHGAHLAIEEREQQRADVAAINVGVGQDNHFVITGFAHIKLVVADATTDGSDQRLNFGVLQHFVEACALDIENFSANWQDRLRSWFACVYCCAAGRVAFNDKQFGFAGVGAGAVFQLVGHTRARECSLAAHCVACIFCSDARLCGCNCFFNDAVCLGGVFLQPLFKF